MARKEYSYAKREKMIEQIVAQAEDWDLDTLIGYAQDTMRENLKTYTDEDLDRELEAALPPPEARNPQDTRKTFNHLLDPTK